MKSSTFLRDLKKNDIRFFTGVPDSLLKNFTNILEDKLDKKEHIIAANEGLAVSMAIGYHLSSKKIPLVYMQNSGLGNAMNPIISLVDKKIYSIPIILMIGWRGEPGIKDEPQHIKQGEVTKKQLETLGIKYILLDKKTKFQKVQNLINYAKKNNIIVALICKKNSFEDNGVALNTKNNYPLSREKAIKLIIDKINKNTVLVSTTGMISRELYENKKFDHNNFLCVGGMGHASSIGFGIAQNIHDKKILCLDGDGSALMHLGSLTTIGINKPKNYVHIMLNNGVHGSVGNQKTLGFEIDFLKIAKACGYEKVLKVTNAKKLISAIDSIFMENKCSFLEIRLNTNYRKEIGRPKETPNENKEKFINFLNMKSK
tara:strand:- start:445 stop:1560 length:1116 start_codon:yes stop_codon:yes gene_type:complete